MDLLAQVNRPLWADVLSGVIGLAILVLFFAALWRLFTKAGRAGWTALVPVYNLFVFIRIAGYGVGSSAVLTVLYLVPLVNIVISIIVGIRLGKQFGKGALYGLGIGLLGFIFVPILAFSDASYEPRANQGTADPAAMDDG